MLLTDTTATNKNTVEILESSAYSEHPMELWNNCMHCMPCYVLAQNATLWEAQAIPLVKRTSV